MLSLVEPPPKVEVTVADLHDKNPSLRPDWRFDRVREMITHQPRTGRCKAYDDGYVREMRKFMLEYAPRAIPARRSLFFEHPGPYHALQMHEDVDGADTRLFLQCRLLARQSNEEIAQATGLLPIAVDWYERMFFNVRERISNRDWILRHVLGHPALRQLNNSELPLKLLSYFGGVQVANFMFSGTRDVEQPQTAEEVVAYVMDYATDGICRKAAMAVYMYEPNRYKAEMLMDSVRQLKADTKAKEDETNRQEVVASAVRKTIESIRLIKGDMALEYLREHQPIMVEFDRFATELRDNELYEAVSGKHDRIRKFKDLRLPAPSARQVDLKDSAKDGIDANVEQTG